MRRFAETSATPHRLPSGPLHDAAEIARTGVPVIMMFVQSLHGISHKQDGGHEGGASRIGGHRIRQIGRGNDAVDRDELSAKVHCKSAGLGSLCRTRCKSLC